MAMRKAMILVLVCLSACDGEGMPPDGGSPMTCGTLGDVCCVGTVNGVPTPVCNEETKCEGGVCVEIVPVWTDAGSTDGMAGAADAAAIDAEIGAIDAAVDPPDAAAPPWTGWTAFYYLNMGFGTYAVLDLDEATGTGLYRFASTWTVYATVTATATGPTTIALTGYCEMCSDPTCAASGCLLHRDWTVTQTAAGFEGDEVVVWGGTGMEETRHIVGAR